MRRSGLRRSFRKEATPHKCAGINSRQTPDLSYLAHGLKLSEGDAPGEDHAVVVGRMLRDGDLVAGAER